MARRIVPVAGVTRFAVVADSTPVPTDITNGMVMINDGATYLRITSTLGSTGTVTFLVPGGADVNLSVGPRVDNVTANLKGSTGFFPVSVYGSQLLFTASSALISFAAYSFAV